MPQEPAGAAPAAEVARPAHPSEGVCCEQRFERQPVVWPSTLLRRAELAIRLPQRLNGLQLIVLVGAPSPNPVAQREEFGARTPRRGSHWALMRCV